MKIPKSFQLMGSTWKVEEVPNLGVLGQCLRDTLTIQLRKEIPKTVKETTFCHELHHCFLYQMGITEHSEEKVDLMGALLHQYLNTAK